MVGPPFDSAARRCRDATNNLLPNRPVGGNLLKEIAVSISRAEYFKDLIEDCEIAVHQYPPDHRPLLIAALILSDSLNGLRKAMLQARYAYVDKD